MIQIKRNNKVFFTLEDFGEGSKLSYQLMDHHYIILKFTTATPVYFEIGDSVEIPDFGYFELTSAYFPKHNGSDGYDYEMQMDAYYMAWKNKLCKYRPQHGANETSFKLTTTVGVHMNVILGNLKALGLTYNGKEFSVDYTTYNNKAFDVQKRFLIEYGSISILDALNSICSEDALNCEWWIDGSIIYLGYCEMEGQTTFEQDVNVLSMSYSESKSTYITRLYAFGSDRNIPKGYFTGADADVTTDGIATDYLMLPNKEVDSDGFYAKDGYLENVNVVKNDKQAIEGVVMFEEEYPKVESVVSSIKTYDSTVDNDDGTKTTQTFWQVTATDSFATIFESSWIKSNLTLGIKFTSGALMGMEFDVSFKVIDKVNYFEIVANDTYGRTLPDGVMCPKIGDKFFLFNWDATKITDTDLIPAAQLSLFDRSKQYYQKAMISNSNFTCTMDGEKFYNDGTYDYHPLGEQVKLINDMFAQVDADGKHYRNSRIIGMEIPLDIPYDHPQYTVGEKASSSRLGKLEDKVDSITVNGIQINGGNGGGGVYVIGTNDSTPPTDSNVLSARKSINNFLSKLKPDTAKELITFAKGLVSNMLAKLNGGAYFGNGGALIDEDGNIIADSLKSIGFDKAANEGFGMEMDGGQSHLYLANLTVWGKMMINILEIMKTKYAGGNIYMSAAGGTIVKVVPVGMWDDDESEWVENPIEEAIQGWKCYILADDGDNAVGNPWQEGDQVRCQSMGNLLGTRYANATNKSYWRTIPEHGVSSFNEYIYNDYGTPTYNGKMFYWIVLGKHSTDFDGYTEENAPVGTTDIPEAGDSIVLDGSRKDTSRQGVLQLSSYGSGAPSIVGLRGVSDYSHENCAIFELSYDYVRIFAERFKLIAKDNKVVEITNFRGEWDPNERYYKNDQVSHNNAIWTCVKDTDFQTEPTDGSTYWRKEVYGQKGEDGSSFKVLGTAVKHFTNADDIGGELLDTKEYLFDDTSGLPDGVASPCIATYMKDGAGHMWVICKSNEGDSYMIGDDLWTNSGTAWLNIGNVKGVSISSTSVTYGVSASGTQEPSSWYSIIPPTTDEYPYLWTRTVVNYTDGKSTTSYSVSHNGKDGAKGDPGDKGADAITIQLVGAPLIFNAGSDGIVPKGVTNYARLYVTVGEKDVSEYVGQPFSVPSEGMNVSPEDGYVIERREYNEKRAWYLGIKSDAISKVYLSDNKTEVSATSGYITFAFVYGANQYVGQLPFQVNVARYTGEFTLTNKQFKVSMDGLTTRMGAAEEGITNVNTKLNTEVKTLHAEITSTASTVKAEVKEEMNGNLKKAGLEVKADGITLYGDKITITNDDGKTTTALFAGGKINASLIDADQIEVKHLWAKSNDGASKVGYFGNTEEEACKIDDTYAPLFVGADTAKNSPFYVTNKGHMVSKSATLGSFSLNESSLRYLTGYDDEEPGFALYNEYMVFRGYSRTFSPQTKKWTSERNRLIWVGRNDWVYSVPSLMSNILVQDSFPMTTGDTAKIGLRISVTGCDDKYQYENDMYNGAMGSNVYGNFAIYAENGMYAGFRPMTRRANYSMKLTELDCVIYVSVTGITLTLPDNPQRGQYYKFIQGAGGEQAFWIKSNSYKMYWNGVDTNGRTSFFSGAYNQTTELIFLGDHWRVNWYRESAI